MSELLGRRRILEPKNLVDGPIPSPPSWSLAVRRKEATRTKLKTSRPPHQHSQDSGRKSEPINTGGKRVELSKQSRIHFEWLKPESGGQAEVQVDGGSILLPGLGPCIQKPGEILDAHEDHSAPTPGPTSEDSVTATNGPEVEAVESAVDQVGCTASQLVDGPTLARIRSLQGRQNGEDAQKQPQASDDGAEKSMVPQLQDNSPTMPAYKPTEKRRLKYVRFRSFSTQAKPQLQSQWKSEQHPQQQQHHNHKQALIEEVDGLYIMDDIDPPAADIRMFNRKIVVQLRNVLKSTKGSMDERSDRSSIEFLMTQDNGSIGTGTPTIVIFCASSHRKAEITHKIGSSEQQKLLESFNFPVRVLHDQELRYLSQPQTPNISTWRVYKKSASNDGTLCAALIKMVSNAHVDTEPFQSEATLGGLIVLGDSLYGLTVAHPLLRTLPNRNEAPLTSHATESESHATVLTSVASINDGSGKNTALEPQQASENELPVGRIYRYALSDELSSQGGKKGAEGHVAENSDWALVDFEGQQLLLDTFANSLQINVQPWDNNGFNDTEHDDTFSRDVTIMSGVSGKVHGVLSMTKSVLSLEGSIFNVHRIVMDCMETLDRGDSGSWVINHDGILCGVIIAGRQSMNWAYMLPIADVFHSISNYFPDAVVRLATKRDIMGYRAIQSRKSPQTSKSRAASPDAIRAVGESSSRNKPPIPRSIDRDTALTSDSISKITAESAELKDNHNVPEVGEKDNYKAITVAQRRMKWNAELNAVLSHISFKRDTTVWEEPTDTDYALESIFPATQFREHFARSDMYTSPPCTCWTSQPDIRPWTWWTFQGLPGVDTHVVRFLVLLGDVCPLSQMVRDRLFSMDQSIIKKSPLIEQLLRTRGGENILALMTAICIKPSSIPGDDVVSSNVGSTMTLFGKIQGRKISSRVCVSLLKCLSSLAEALGIPTAMIPSQNQFEQMAKVLWPAMHMLREGLYPYLSTSHRKEMYHWDANYGRLSKYFWIPPRRTLTEAIMALKLLAVEETTTSASYEGRHVLWISWYASEALGMRTYLWMNDVQRDDCGYNQGYIPLSRLRGVSEPPGQVVFLRLQDSPHDSWKKLDLFRGSEDLYIPDMLYGDDANAFGELIRDRARWLNKHESSSLPTRPVWQPDLDHHRSSSDSTRVDVASAACRPT